MTFLDPTRIWAQTTTLGIDPLKMPLLALKRWCSSTTLASPESFSSFFGLWTGLISLAVLVLVVIVIQGPVRAISQGFDLPGHWRVFHSAMGRLRRSPRLLAILLGAAVVSWTGWELRGFSHTDRLEDLAILLKNKTVVEVSVEQAYLAALTPLRDLASLGDLWLLLVASTLIVFKLSADRWGMIPSDVSVLGIESPPSWTSSAWASGALYALYRAVQDTKAPDGLPIGGCMFLEAAFVPLLMLASDGLLLGWVMAELARARPDQLDATEGYALLAGLDQMPRAMLACLIVVPARYAAPAVWLALPHLGSVLSTSQVLEVASVVSGRGLIVIQAVSVLFLGMVGALSWGRGTLPRFGRMLRHQGARMIVWVVTLSALIGGVSGLATWLVLSLPSQSWVLTAADTYAHLASFPLALLLLAGLIELGHQVEPNHRIDNEAIAFENDPLDQETSTKDPVGSHLR